MRGSFIYGFLFLFILIQDSYSQQNVGIGTNSPNPSAALDIVATDKGVLIPRVQASQRLLISPVDGLMVYDTDSSSLFIYENTAWKRLRSVTSLSSLISGVNPNDVLVWNGMNWVVTPKCSLFTYFFRDEDGDGKGDKYRPVYGCTPLPGFVADSTDCNDTNPLIYGGAVELCNGIDDDCDGFTDEGCVNVIVTGIGTGTVSSSPAGISCPGDCKEPFPVSTAVTLNAAPATGSVFAGWTGACSGTGTCVVTAGNSPQNVTATFDIQQFALSVTRSGPGSGSVTSAPAGINCGTDCSESYDYGTLVTLTATPNAGSTFAGWSGACSGTGSCVVTMDAAKTVNANFGVQQLTLTVAKTGSGSGTVNSSPAGINCGSTCSGVYPYGASVTLTAIPDAGSTFTGWSGGGCSGTGTCVVTMDAAKSVTANFTAIPYNLTINKTGSGTVTSSPAGINCGADCSEAYSSGTVVTLTATPDAGASFLGWSGDCSGTGACVVTMNAARTVAATFSQLQFTLTVSKAGTGTGTVSSAPAGINCGADCSESYNSGTMVTLTATPGAGSTFTGWTGACSGTGSCVVTMDAAKSVTANFGVQQFSLDVSKAGVGTGTVTSSPSGINCGTDCSESYNFGTMVSLTATPGAGSTFTGWSGGGCSGTGTCVVTMDAAKTVTANFGVQQFSLDVSKAGTGTGTVSSAPAGINCGADCSESYNSGTMVTLTATPGAGSTFTGWTGACSGTGSCVVTMDAAKTVTANFALQQLTLTVSKTGTGTGTVSSAPAGISCGADCSETYDYGTVVTLTATPGAGSTFTGWSGGGCSGTGTCVVSMDAAKTVTANFALQQLTLSVQNIGTASGTVTSIPSGISCGSDCSETYNYGTVVTLTATPNAGASFLGWTGACTGTGSCVVTMDAAKSVIANYALQQFTLTISKTGTGTGTVTSTPAGITCGADCSEPYNYSTVVTLTATPDGSSTFTGWSGACTGTGSCVLTMNAAKTVTANFTNSNPEPSPVALLRKPEYFEKKFIIPSNKYLSFLPMERPQLRPNP